MMRQDDDGTPGGGPAKATGDATVGDDRVSAWSDGMLDENGMAEMDRLAAKDPDIAMRGARIRHIDALVREAVPLDEGVPPALLERLGLAEPAGQAGPGADVIDLAAARAQRTKVAAAAAGQGFVARHARIAAGLALVLGLGVSVAVWRGPGSVTPEQGRPADYVALGDAARPGAGAPANAIVLFAPQVPADQARLILTRAGARIVTGPSPAGVWQLALAPARRDAVLAGLRGRGDVRLAETLGGAGR
ncbi:MAG: hypothetical protein KGM17_00355 [Sphingomonadales bacterium]|nr:hypothetical protein [Sphingomonadales bacterium]